MRLRVVEARTDDYCEGCGYPFDPGERVNMDPRSGFVYCGPRCAGILEGRRERAERRRAAEVRP